jgi:hypothetical protein
MRHGNHADHGALHAANQRVGEMLQRPGSHARIAGAADLRHELEQGQSALHGPFDLFGDGRTAVCQIPLRCIEKFPARLRSKLVRRHDLFGWASIMARKSAITFSAGMPSTSPASISSTRRTISASHAGCSGGAGNTVSMSRLINSARSSAESCNAAASTIPKVALRGHSGVRAGLQSSDCCGTASRTLMTLTPSTSRPFNSGLGARASAA